jgi:hypothetical protein
MMIKPWVLKLINFWPPFLGSGIRVKKISPDLTSVDVEMKMRFWNKNYVGSHYGGSLFSMTDPFLMLMLINNLGRDYIVWDKVASIRFKKPGKGTVRAHFQITPEEIESIRLQADQGAKVEPVFQVLVLDESGAVVAEVKKTLYVRRKN